MSKTNNIRLILFLVQLGGDDLLHLPIKFLLFIFSSNYSIYTYNNNNVEPSTQNTVSRNGNSKTFILFNNSHSLFIIFMASNFTFRPTKLPSLSSQPFSTFSSNLPRHFHSTKRLVFLCIAVLHPESPLQLNFNSQTFPHSHCIA